MDLPLIHVVCLDAYGTLCRINERHNPYPSLFRLLGVDPGAAARRAMTCDLDIEELARVLAPGHAIDLSDVIQALAAEVASVSLFDDVAVSLARLRRLGLKLWVASNLASPYAIPLTTMLTDLVDGFCFSFRIGSIKPEPAFFGELCSRARCSPHHAVMVGDNKRADVEGARAAGLRAIHLVRDAANIRPDSVGSLGELADLLEQGVPAAGT